MIVRTGTMTRSENLAALGEELPRAYEPLDRCALTEKAVRIMGCPSVEAAGGPAIQAAEDLYGALCSRLRPAALFAWAPLKGVEKGAILTEHAWLASAKWARLASLCREPEGLAAFAVTLGPGVEDWIRELAASSLLASYVADAMASALAESMAGLAEELAASRLREASLSCTSRFSPGYCDLPLDGGQGALSALMDPAEIGVRIASSGLMRPRKSVTAFMVAAKEVPHPTPCVLCKRDCPHRRAAPGAP